MLEISIPQVNEESRNVKDLVFTILSHEQPLSIIQLTNKIKKQYVLNATYQAVRKAVNNLHEKNVLTKHDKKYKINKEWVMKMKSFFDNLLTTYETGSSIKLFSVELAKEDYAVYTFSSLHDLDNFWGDILWYLADNTKDNKNYVAYGHYGWWFLINLGRETKLFEHVIKRGIKTSFHFLRDLPLNRWGAKLYEDIGVKVKIYNDKKIYPEVAVNVFGDVVIQIKYPKKIVAKIKHLFEKYKSVQEMNLKEITLLTHEQCEIKFIMFKNPTIAKNLLEQYEL